MTYSVGTWTWSDSTEWNYENWKSGEPNNYDYLAISSDGEWYDSYNSIPDHSCAVRLHCPA